MTSYEFFNMLLDGRWQEVNVEKIKEGGSCGVLEFAALYIALYRLTKKVASQFFNLTLEDKESFAVEELWKAVQDYSQEKGELSNLYYTYYRNRLKAETNRLNYDKRKANYMLDAASACNIFYGEVEEDAMQADMPLQQDDSTEVIVLQQAIQSASHLTDTEKQYCQLLLENEYKDIEAAEILGVTPATIHYMKKRLQDKIKTI